MQTINSLLFLIEARKNYINEYGYQKYKSTEFDFGHEVANDFILEELYKQVEDLIWGVKIEYSDGVYFKKSK